MSLITRATNIVKTPKTEWDIIAAESATSQGLVTGYAMPWSLLAHTAGFVSSAYVSTVAIAFVGVHVGVTYWLGAAVVGWILTIIGLFISATVVNALADRFGSVKNDVNAMKLVVYAHTSAWIGGIAVIIPVLGPILSLAGMIYSIYLFYLGVPVLMHTPKERVVGYMVASALVMAIVYLVMGLITTAIAGAFFVTSAASIMPMN